MEFTDPSSTKLKNLSENWNGYHISTKKPENQRHYIAKCLYCEKEFKGKPAELMKHKLNNCSKKSAWPKELRGIGRAEPPIKIQGQELISKFTQNTRPVDFIKILASINFDFLFHAFFSSLSRLRFPMYTHYLYTSRTCRYKNLCERQRLSLNKC